MELADMIRTRCPGAQLWFHQIWAYEWGFERPVFVPYNRDQNDTCDFEPLVNLNVAKIGTFSHICKFFAEKVVNLQHE